MHTTYFETNGVTLHAATAGQPGNPLIVLLHGFPECWYSWRHQMPLLAEAGYYVVAPDMRGYNLSQKPHHRRAYAMRYLAVDVKGLIDHCGNGKAVLVGHDWGAAVSWIYAMRYPQTLNKLVICNVPHPAKMAAGLRAPQQIVRSWYMFFFQIPWLPEWLLTRDPWRMAELMRRTSVRKAAFSDADLEVYAAAYTQPGTMRAMINYYRNIFSLIKYADQPRLIDTPTLMLWGENDVALGKELTYGTEKYVPNLKIHYIPNCGHWVQQEAADEVNREMLAFVGHAQPLSS